MRYTFPLVIACFAGFLLIFCAGCAPKIGGGSGSSAGPLYEYCQNSTPRWISPENPAGQKGQGGLTNNGAKGRPSTSIPAGGTLRLVDIEGSGIVSRIWITINDRSPQMLRSLKLEMFWDHGDKPAVSVPLGDFFGVGLGRMAAFHNVFFADPEGRSFNCYIPMPFRTGARIVLTNESDKELPNIFFDVDLQLTKQWKEDNLYFHAFWHRDTATTLGKDFELLPAVAGKGRFLGVNVGVNSNPLYGDLWWGEGEVKMYLDGDGEHPTLAGTGTEDYIGTAWGQGKFFTDYTGCLVAEWADRQWAFYRFHVPDPVFFATDCKVTLQQIGGGPPRKVWELQKALVPLLPVTVGDGTGTHLLYKKDSVASLDAYNGADGWTNFYRSDDVSATAYFYLDKPAGVLPVLQSPAIRTYNLKKP